MLVYQVYVGNPFHLRMSLNQVLKHFPADRVYLIGDESNQTNGPWRHVLADLDHPDLNRLKRSYVHLSTNPEWFELLCIQRWFLILHHLLAIGHQGPFVYLDSDTLIHTDFGVDRSEMPDLACVDLTGPQFALFRDVSVLKRFTEFILEQYEDPSRLLDLRKFYDTKGSALPWHGGNVCDMHLMGLFALSLGTSYRDINSLGLGGHFEKHIGELEGFKMDRRLRLKKVDLDPNTGTPSIFRGSIRIPLLGQHFVGWAKALMPQYYQSSTPVPLTEQEQASAERSLAARRASARIEALKDLARPIKRLFLSIGGRHAGNPSSRLNE